MKGELYCVGVGPGDKELITLKAVRVLREADIIAAPITKNGDRTAYDIAAEFIAGKPVVDCFMPMSKNTDELERNYAALSDELEKHLSDGKTVALLTLGDPTVYSTCMQINEIIKNRGYETEIISGVTSFCAAAARLGVPLCERDEALVILPASYDLSEGMCFKGTKVLMKASRKLPKVRDMLKKGRHRAYMVEKCGMDGEKVYTSIDDVDESSYFSTIIVKDE